MLDAVPNRGAMDIELSPSYYFSSLLNCFMDVVKSQGRNPSFLDDLS